jgi:hypothetical protein
MKRECRNPGKNTVVILSEAKNLIIAISYKIEILRLMPQNDIMTQSRNRGGDKGGEVFTQPQSPNKSLVLLQCFGGEGVITIEAETFEDVFG